MTIQCALKGYAPDDVAGILSDRIEKERERLEETIETIEVKPQEFTYVNELIGVGSIRTKKSKTNSSKSL